MRKVIPIIIMLSLLLSGCGFRRGIYANYRAIEQLRPVQTLGLDAAGDGVVLSAVTGAADPDKPPLLLKCAGDSLLPAMERLQDYTERGELFFAHTRWLVLGEDYARAGLRGLLDYVERDMHLRTGTLVAVLRGAEASALLTGARGGDATELLASARRDALQRGDTRFTSVREIARSLSEDGAALVCALDVRAAEGSVFPEGEGLSISPAGYGILRGARLVGFLTGDEARCASLLLGHPGVQQRTVEAAGGRYVVELDSAAPEKRLRSGTLELRAVLKCAVAERAVPLSEASDADLADALCAAVAAKLEREIAAVVEASRAADADFLGLARLLRRAGEAEDAPGRGEAAPDGGSWAWREIPVRISVTAALDRGGDLAAPIGTGGAA